VTYGEPEAQRKVLKKRMKRETRGHPASAVYAEMLIFFSAALPLLN
jgi:hypothetical protein